MSEQIFKKVGRKYVPISPTDGWNGFPTDGIWLVRYSPTCKSSECILKLDDINENIDVKTLTALQSRKNDVVKYIAEQIQLRRLNVYDQTLNEFANNIINILSTDK